MFVQVIHLTVYQQIKLIATDQILILRAAVQTFLCLQEGLSKASQPEVHTQSNRHVTDLFPTGFVQHLKLSHRWRKAGATALINGEDFLPGWSYFSPCYTGFNFTALNFNKSTTLTLSCTESTSLVEVSSCSLACWWVFISAFSCDCSSWTRFYFFKKIFSHFLHK